MLVPVACLIASGMVGACVTEVVPVKPANGIATGPLNTTPPVATAAPGNASQSSRIAAAIKPIGAVPYDGLTLPLVTPDGRWIVTQIGSIPSWEAVLAEPGAVPVPANAIAAFEIVDGALRRITWPDAPPNGGGTAPGDTAGLLLGRAAGDGWVLVERPNPDRSRWIGKFDLASGSTQWLVQGSDVNAQGLLLRNGTLIYTRRAVTQAASELVLRPAVEEKANAVGGAQGPAAERVVRREGWRFCQPLATPDQTIVAVLAISAQESELLAYSTTMVDAAGAPLLIGKQSLGQMSAAAAFQAVTSVESCPPDVESSLRTAVLFVNADRRRLAVWDPVRGSTNLLPSSVMAAARVKSAGAAGLVMASSKGIDFWTESSLPVRLVAGAYIPRTYNAPSGTCLLLLSPQTDSIAPALRVIGIELVQPKP